MLEMAPVFLGPSANQIQLTEVNSDSALQSAWAWVRLCPSDVVRSSEYHIRSWRGPRGHGTNLSLTSTRCIPYYVK